MKTKAYTLFKEEVLDKFKTSSYETYRDFLIDKKIVSKNKVSYIALANKSDGYIFGISILVGVILTLSSFLIFKNPFLSFILSFLSHTFARKIIFFVDYILWVRIPAIKYYKMKNSELRKKKEESNNKNNLNNNEHEIFTSAENTFFSLLDKEAEANANDYVQTEFDEVIILLNKYKKYVESGQGNISMYSKFINVYLNEIVELIVYNEEHKSNYKDYSLYSQRIVITLNNFQKLINKQLNLIENLKNVSMDSSLSAINTLMIQDGLENENDEGK